MEYYVQYDQVGSIDSPYYMYICELNNFYHLSLLVESNCIFSWKIISHEGTLDLDDELDELHDRPDDEMFQQNCCTKSPVDLYLVRGIMREIMKLKDRDLYPGTLHKIKYESKF